MSDTKLNEARSITTSPERLTELVDISIELARAVATNPSAPSDLLQKLSKYDDLETRRNIAFNPNTATDILFKLAQDFPEEFLNNPIFPLLLLENPNLAETIPADTLLELLQVGNVPQVFIEWALQAPSNYKVMSSSTYNYKNWCLAIASNPNNTKELLLKLYQQFPKTNIAQAALLHVNLNGEINSYWNEAAFIEIRTCGYILRNKTEEQLLQEFGIIPKHLRPYSEAYRYAVSLYKHSISTYQYVDLLNRIPLVSPIIHYIIDYLNNQNKIFDLSTPIEALLFFLSIPYLLIKSAIEFSFKHKKILGILIFINLSIIACTSINFSQLKFLVILIFIIILLFIGVTGFLFGVILIIFLNTASIGIALLSYPVRKLYDLTKDFNQATFKRKHLFRYSSNIFRQDLEAAKNPNTSPTRLFELASSRWLEVREVVAANPNADTKVLKKLAQDESLKLQVLVAKHSNTPVEIFIEFAKSKSVDKKIAVAQNIQTPFSTLKYLALYSREYEIVCLEAIKTIKQRYPEELTNILVAYVEKTPFPTAARLFLLLHKTTLSDFLARHYRSLDWRERYAVAQNPNTPLNILEKLRFDANCIVRATAKARF